MHPRLVAELLEMESTLARDRLGDRVSSIDVVGTHVVCVIAGTNLGVVRLRFDGARYDAEPLAIAVIDEMGGELPASHWPGALFHSEHPILHRPWSCTQGTYEYHAFPGHVADPWDAYRAQIRLPELLDHLLRKAKP